LLCLAAFTAAAMLIAGAIYLLWLGSSSLFSRGNIEQRPTARRGPRMRRGYAAGLATDLLNPKVGVFFVTFLPGFVPHGYPVGWVSLLLGAIFVGLTALYFAGLLMASEPVTRWMGTAQIRRRMDWLTGFVLVGFGMRLALES
jgi:threonine/homoserine/homoserine lactone efflux protein